MREFLRKRYIIDKKFQYKLLLKFFILISVIAILLLVVIKLFFDKSYKFSAGGEIVLLYKEIPEYQDKRITGYTRFNYKGELSGKIQIILDNNGRIIAKKSLSIQNKENEREEFRYNDNGIKVETKYFIDNELKNVSQYEYIDGRISTENVFDNNNRLLKVGVYQYTPAYNNNKKMLIKSVTYFRSDIEGNRTDWEEDRWEYTYNYIQKYMEAQYKRKDGILYLIKINRFKDENFEILISSELREDRFTDQFKDFLFQPVYNKDGDIINLRDDPLNKYRMMIQPILITSVIILLAFLVFGILVSHRMAGPVYRIKKFINNLLKGEINDKLTLRKGDEFKDLAKPLQELAEHIKENALNLKDAIKSVELQSSLRGTKFTDFVERLKDISDDLYKSNK